MQVFVDFVEVQEGKVTVCRDFAKGKCQRPFCKYYHVPVQVLLGGHTPALLSRLAAGATFDNNAHFPHTHTHPHLILSSSTT